MLTQEILELAGRMCGQGADREILLPLCQAARLEVESWLALAGLETSRNEAGVSSFTAGDLTIRKEGGSSVEGLREQAWTLMAPFRRDTFCFQGVRG